MAPRAPSCAGLAGAGLFSWVWNTAESQMALAQGGLVRTRRSRVPRWLGLHLQAQLGMVVLRQNRRPLPLERNVHEVTAQEDRDDPLFFARAVEDPLSR